MIISQTVFNLQSGQVYMVEMTMFNVKRAITPKVGKSDLLFMCSAHCFILLYIYVKFCENITKGIRIMELTRVHGRDGYVQCSKGNNSINRQSRVTVHVSWWFTLV